MNIKREVKLSCETDETVFEYETANETLCIFDKTNHNKLSAMIVMSSQELDAMRDFLTMAIEEGTK